MKPIIMRVVDHGLYTPSFHQRLKPIPGGLLLLRIPTRTFAIPLRASISNGQCLGERRNPHSQ